MGLVSRVKSALSGGNRNMSGSQFSGYAQVHSDNYKPFGPHDMDQSAHNREQASPFKQQGGIGTHVAPPQASQWSSRY